MATLKISDLSVGDWVRWEVYDKTYDMQVSGVTDRRIYGLHDGIEYSMLLTQISPIPITTEILERNGFEEDNNGHYTLKIGGIVAVDIEYTGGIWELSILDVYALQYAGKMQVTIAFVSSIHNLQHALMLAGIDKEINL